MSNVQNNFDKAIVVDKVHKSFGDFVALHDVSFEVARGEVLGLLGPNGAGKTTLVDILSTLSRPDQGRALVAGYDVVSEPAGVRRSIMLTGQQVAIDETLTGLENLFMFGRLFGLKKAAARSRANELIDEFDLAYAANRRVKTYSGGMRRRIDIACGLVVPPQVVFLDEPTTGLDPQSRNALWELIRELVSDGTTVLLTTQYLEEADQLAERVVVVDEGRVIADDTPAALKTHLGNTVIELDMDDQSDAVKAADVIAGRLGETPQVEGTRLRLSPRNASGLLRGILNLLEADGLVPRTVAVRESSLDDVFLALTGHRTQTGPTTDSANTGGKP